MRAPNLTVSGAHSSASRGSATPVSLGRVGIQRQTPFSACVGALEGRPVPKDRGHPQVALSLMETGQPGIASSGALVKGRGVFVNSRSAVAGFERFDVLPPACRVGDEGAALRVLDTAEGSVPAPSMGPPQRACGAK